MKKETFQYLYIGFSLLSLVIILLLLFFVELPETNSRLIYYILGCITTIAVTGANFIIGTSKSSQDKDNIINNNIKNK